MNSKVLAIKKMKAKRYAEHLRRAKASLDTYNYLDTNPKHELVQFFEKKDFLLIAVDYSIASLEALINHLGFIFVDDWENYENRNFWFQYKILIKKLIELGIKVENYQKTPYSEFDDLRNNIRNPSHHVKSSKHDIKSIERNHTLDIHKDLRESSEMLKSWVNPKPSEAALAYKKTRDFVDFLHNEFKTRFFHSLELVQILKREEAHKRDDDRKELLRSFIYNPYNPQAIVSGNYAKI